MKLNRQFSDEVKVASKYMKKCLTSLAIMEMQIKTTLSFNFTPVRKARISTARLSTINTFIQYQPEK
jgi:hypothetical protein